MPTLKVKRWHSVDAVTQEPISGKQWLSKRGAEKEAEKLQQKGHAAIVEEVPGWDK